MLTEYHMYACMHVPFAPYSASEEIDSMKTIRNLVSHNREVVNDVVKTCFMS